MRYMLYADLIIDEKKYYNYIFKILYFMEYR